METSANQPPETEAGLSVGTSARLRVPQQPPALRARARAGKGARAGGCADPGHFYGHGPRPGWQTQNRFCRAPPGVRAAVRDSPSLLPRGPCHLALLELLLLQWAGRLRSQGCGVSAVVCDGGSSQPGEWRSRRGFSPAGGRF